MGSQPLTILDTHVWLWYLLDDPSLSAVFKQRLEENPAEVFVPSICLWEALMLAEKGRIEVKGDSPATVLMDLMRSCGFTSVPLTNEIAVLSRTLAFQHDDPADRFIAATAYALQGELATSDERLRNLPWIKLAY